MLWALKLINFTFKCLPKRPNELLRKHWAVITKEKNQIHFLVKLAVGHQKPDKPFTKAKLTLIRYSTREPDYDGLVGSFKYVIDGLVKCGVLIDDKPSVITCKYEWAKCLKKDQRIEVTINLG